MIIKYFQKEL